LVKKEERAAEVPGAGYSGEGMGKVKKRKPGVGGTSFWLVEQPEFPVKMSIALFK
jgi:hypothetical protein